MAAVRRAHELRQFDRVLIHRDVHGSDVATIVGVFDASFAGEGLVDVVYQWSTREHARQVRVSRETVFPYLGSEQEAADAREDARSAVANNFDDGGVQ